MVYAPDLQWAEMVISEMETFPKGKYDDLTDSTTQALRHLRLVGMAQTADEVIASERERFIPKGKLRPLYRV